MDKNRISDFLNPDISYLLGLITGRGEIQYTPQIKRIVIDFNYRSLETEALTKSFDQKLHIQTSLDPIVARLNNMGIVVRKVVADDNISIELSWQLEDIAWQFIKYLINNTRFSYHDFAVPDSLFEASEANRREFLRGLGDVTGYVRKANRDQGGRQRIYIEVSNRNWKLPPQICKLVQSLGIATQNINYGHPNLRHGSATSWAKEHQYKVYAEDYEGIGFYISHKNESLKELADYNRETFGRHQRLCDGTIRRINIKESHQHETHEKLPDELNGRHFDHFKQIGLDFAEARMYESRNGRFTAVDPLLASGKSANPQTFNRYAYVMNSPTTLADPSGLLSQSTGADGGCNFECRVNKAIAGEAPLSDDDRYLAEFHIQNGSALGYRFINASEAEISRRQNQQNIETSGFSQGPVRPVPQTRNVRNNRRGNGRGNRGRGGNDRGRGGRGRTPPGQPPAISRPNFVDPYGSHLNSRWGLTERLGVTWRNFAGFKRAYGNASTGNQWHHVVEQSQAQFGAARINSPGNLIQIRSDIHRQRGLNENTNGLIRQFFPKQMKFAIITDEQVKEVEDKLNNRPRKSLGYQTPNEVYFKEQEQLTKVALTT